MNATEMLKRYSELQAQQDDIANQLDFLSDCLNQAVQETGSQLSAFGLVARMKPGRRTIDHERAVNAEVLKHHKAGGDHDRVISIRELIDANSTTKVTVKWEQVTKKAGIDTAPFTTEAPAVFVIESLG